MRYTLPLLCSLIPALVVASNLDRPRAGFFETVLESPAVNQKRCKPTGLIQDACCDFETVESVNDNLYTGLNSLVAKPFFRYHKVDLLRECPFWQEDGSCMNIACSVETTDEEHVPEEWRSRKLGELDKRIPVEAGQAAVGCQVDDSDFCVLEDEMDSEGQYVDLMNNPERFTGYAGASSSRVWKAIYEENCFTPVPFIDPSRPISEGGSGYAPLSSMAGMSGLGGVNNGFGGLVNPGNWKAEERKLMGSLAGPRDGGDEVCLEKRVFYRLISGLHASISIHICDDYLDQATGKWSPNLECFITRIAQHPERLQNVYFTYVLLLRALSKSGAPLVAALEATSSDHSDGTKTNLEELVKIAQGCPSTFDETSMFSGPSSVILKTEFKEHFRNVSRIMDCVGCEKCRLWGKLQVTGLGTALKLLFSYDETLDSKLTGPESGLLLSRGEAVAFVNTVHRFSESLHAVESFRKLWANRDRKEKKELEAKLIEVAERLAAPTIQTEEEILSSAEVEIVVEEEEEEIEIEDVVESSEEPAEPLEFALSDPPTPSPTIPDSPLPSSISSPSAKPNLFSQRRILFEKWLEICRESWVSCVEMVLGFTRGVVVRNSADRVSTEL